MEITTYSNFRRNLKSFLDNVFDNHVPLFVTRTNGEDVVVLSKSDYNSMKETLHLLTSPTNAQRLKEAKDQIEAGKGTNRDLIE